MCENKTRKDYMFYVEKNVGISIINTNNINTAIYIYLMLKWIEMYTYVYKFY